MGIAFAGLKPKSAQITAVITRADGTKEDLGVIAYYHKDPRKRLKFWLKKLVKFPKGG